ncbi:protein polyglycylase TTLL10-like [Amblyraja radiata]|uniref:protein polyglycylase TTLL10-like n=1 Tax=Amblyraja radiata TaxID=386614 RepID=UPI00140421D7|nr:protein polyglycylase TTLL10-like [Amblyraja radiata]
MRDCPNTVHHLYCDIHIIKDDLPPGIEIVYKTDGRLFNLARLKSKTKTSVSSLIEFQYADNCVAALSDNHLQQILTAFNSVYTKRGFTINPRRLSVAHYCEFKGWKRIFDNNRGDYFLKWSEYKTPIHYLNFRAGKQLLNQIPNNRFLTTKGGLCTSLKEYERIVIKYSKGRCSHKDIRLDEFFPASYRMDVKSERQAFFDVFKDGQIWICKPSNLQEGRGIFLLRCRGDVNVLRAKLESMENLLTKPAQYNSIVHRVVQRYIARPLLLDGRKFDVRSYFLIACTSPYMAFFHHGYAKSTCNIYNPSSDDLTSHLTNQFIQRKNPRYSEMKEDTIWSMEHLNDYINEKYMEAKRLPKDWVFTVFAKRMQEIMTTCLNSAKNKLECKLGFFDLMGCDFIIDQNFKVWLLEMNANPSLQRHCSVLRTLIPPLVYETLDLVIEIFKKSSKGILNLPLESQRDFVLIYNGCNRGQALKPVRDDKISLMLLKQPKRVVTKKPVRKQEAVMSLSDDAAVEKDTFQKASTLLSCSQLPVLAQIRNLVCIRPTVHPSPFADSHSPYSKEWRQLRSSVAKALMSTVPFVPPFGRKCAQVPQKSKSLESNLILK